MPQLGERIRVQSYQYSDGAKGNLPPASVTSLPAQPAKLCNPFGNNLFSSCPWLMPAYAAIGFG